MADIRGQIESAADRYADSPALFDGARNLTWRQLDATARLAASQLRTRGDYTSGNVAVSDHNSYDMLIALLTVFDLGTTAILLNPRYPAASLRQQLAPLECRLHLRTGQGTALSATDLKSVTFKAPTDIAGNVELPAPLTFRNQLSTITFTSGSTGSPTPVLHMLRHHYFSAIGSNQNLPVGPGDRWLLSLPLYHVGGLGIMFRCLFGGGAMVLPDTTVGLARQIVCDRITHLSLVPTQLQRLLADDHSTDAAKYLKVILLGGGPIPKSLLQEARKQAFPVYPTYGSTEMASQVATASRMRPDCMQVLPHRQLSISEEGEILVRGETLGLLQTGDGARQPLLGVNGWYHTGDTGYLDKNSCLTVTGRKDNMFISGGENIYPEQIEMALCEIDGIDDAVVVPVDNKDFGHRPVTFLKCQAGISLSEYKSGRSEEEKFSFDHESLTSTLATKLPRFMLPIAYYPWPQGYDQPGLKPDRVFFKDLAAKLNRARS